MTEEPPEQPTQQTRETLPIQLTPLTRFENSVKQFLIFGTSLLFWAVIGVHLSYQPVLVFGMIALYNEALRDYWSILASQSREYGVWPGLLMVLRQEVFWILTISLGLTLIFWALRRTIARSRETFSEVLGDFVWEQVISLGVAIIACTLGAILVGGSFALGMAFETSISLEIGTIIEIVASSLLIFSLILSISFLYFDLTKDQQTRKTARRLILIALPLAIIGLYGASQTFRVETQFTSKAPLPADFLIYSADSMQDIQAGGDKGPEIGVFDQVSVAGQTRLSAADSRRFSGTNHVGGSVNTMRSLYFAGSDIVPDFMPALFHRRPTEIELDLEDRVIQVSYALTLQRAPSKVLDYLPSAQAPQEWGALSANWHQKNLSGPVNGGWGIRLEIEPEAEIEAAEQPVSYTVFATDPPRLETLMQDGTIYKRTLPFAGAIKSLSWHRQTAASLWINGSPAFYFFYGQPQRVEVVNPQGLALKYTALEFAPEQ